MGEFGPTDEAEQAAYAEERERMRRAGRAINFAVERGWAEFPEGFADTTVPDEIAFRAFVDTIKGV